MKRKIYIPGCEAWVSLRQYLQAIRTAKANPDAEFKHGLTCWWSCSGREIVGQFRDGMLARIHEGVPYSLRGIV